MTIAYFILALLNTLSDAIETTYALGEFTRNTILPALVYIYVVSETVVLKTHEALVNTYDDGVALRMTLNPSVS
jgi:hypothetical protein